MQKPKQDFFNTKEQRERIAFISVLLLLFEITFMEAIIQVLEAFLKLSTIFARPQFDFDSYFIISLIKSNINL